MARADDTGALTVTLDNGLRCVALRVPGAVECCGLAIMAGSRDEGDGEHGLAHFVEHTIFKGTRRRRSHHVINRMESVGGELNAYTTKEETFVYTLAPAGNTARAIELLGDLTVNCTFPAAELDKEREVVADEISSYLDAPDAAVYDDFEDAVYAGSSLGHNILGTRRSLAALGSGECRRWVDRCYHADRMVFYYAGPAPMARVAALAARHLTAIPASGVPVERAVPSVNGAFDTTRRIRSHQAHTVMGSRTVADTQPARDALSLCNNILGGPGMNSLLNVSLRERRGLVYTVDSSVARYSDSVLWSVYYGCDREHVALCRQLIVDEMRRVAEGGLTERQLGMARRQFIGQLTLSGAGVENRALSLGRTVLRGEQPRTLSRMADDIAALTAADISRAAAGILTDMSSLTFE